MKESEFQGWVVEVAKRTGWKVWHVPAPMRAGRGGDWVPAREGAGLPDLILLHDEPPRLILAELKGEGGKLSAAQREFLTLARNVAEHLTNVQLSTDLEATLGVYVWHPGLEPLVENILRSKVLL